LFNAAQVLSSYAEELHDSDDASHSQESLSFLGKSIELFQKCLSGQEQELQESLRAKQEIISHSHDHPETEQPPVSQDEEEDSDGEEVEWARVQTEISASDLIDTALALVDSIGLLIRMLPEASQAESKARDELAELCQIGELILKSRLPGYMNMLSQEPPPPPKQTKGEGLRVLSLQSGSVQQDMDEPLEPIPAAERDIVMGTASFQTRLLAAQVLLRIISPSDYAAQLTQVFAAAPKEFPFPSFFLSCVESLQEYCTLATRSTGLDDNQILELQWLALNKADNMINQALAIASAPAFRAATDPAFSNRSSIYLLRGDLQLQRRHLALLPSASTTVANSATVLLKNAGVYYRGAISFAKTDFAPELEQEASIKARIVQALESGVSVNSPNVYVGLDTRQVGRIVQDMLDEELL
jgi:hypothetical protein